eukprot:TRINITY_DN68580_c0_g1_i1.p1 TRINITY_DN68580_c0_g1~~TRINITY_DN68580_c0_g1_i1.p1  ORF type:complete len:315 (-),score=81.82 TRINITY_DN68580_c0_g1_i1:17-961(-)
MQLGSRMHAELLTAQADIARLERQAASDLSISQRLVALLQARSSTAEIDRQVRTLTAEVDQQSVQDAEAMACWDSLGCDDGLLDAPAAEAIVPEGGALQTAAKQEDRTSAIAASLIPALVKDNTVLESNLRDYDLALQAALQELLRVRAEAVEMQSLKNEAAAVNEWLRQEHHARQQLQAKKLALQGRQQDLLAVLQEAAAADDDERAEALVKALAAENSALRSMLFSRPDGSCAPDTPLRCPSFSSRASPSSDGRRPSSTGSSSPNADGTIDIDFPFASQGNPETIVPPLPPMPPPSPPSEHRDIKPMAMPQH